MHTPHGALGGSLTLTRDTVTRFTDRLNETAKIVLLLFLSARKRSSSSRLDRRRSQARSITDGQWA